MAGAGSLLPLLSGNLGAAMTSGGGITGPQQALANWTTAEGEVKNASDFSGMPMSTGHTQADIGSVAKGAFEASQQSQRDAAAESAFINQQASQLFGGIGQGLSALGGKSNPTG